MSDHDRGAYAPPTDAPLTFDARQPVRGTRPVPMTLIISVLVLGGLAAAIFLFYRQGVRQAGQPPQAVGTPVAGMKAAPPAEAQPQDPAAGLSIYKSEDGKPAEAAGQPTFTPPPEQPAPRAEATPAPHVVVSPPAQLPPAQAQPTLRPALPTQPPASAAAPVAPPSPPAKVAQAAPAPKAAAKAETPPPAKAAPAPAKAKPAPPAPAAKPAAGVAAVQIGAFSSQALADKGWNDAAAIAPGLTAGKGKSVEKVDKDGKTLFRTQVTGFASRDAAAAFCDKLKTAGKACFVK